MEFNKIEMDGIIHELQLKYIEITGVRSYVEKGYKNSKENYLSIKPSSDSIPLFKEEDGHLVTNVIMELVIYDKDGKSIALISVKHKIACMARGLDTNNEKIIKKITSVIKYLIFPYFRSNISRLL